MKKRCYNCKYRQRLVRPERKLTCILHEKDIDKDDICDDHENRYPADKQED